MIELDLAETLAAFKRYSASVYNDAGGKPTAALNRRFLMLTGQPQMTKFLIGWGSIPPSSEFIRVVRVNAADYEAAEDERLWEMVWYPFMRDPFALRDALGKVLDVTGGMGYEGSETPAMRVVTRTFERAKAARFIFPDLTVDEAILKLAGQIETARISGPRAATNQANREMQNAVKKLQAEWTEFRKQFGVGQ